VGGAGGQAGSVRGFEFGMPMLWAVAKPGVRVVGIPGATWLIIPASQRLITRPVWAPPVVPCQPPASPFIPSCVRGQWLPPGMCTFSSIQRVGEEHRGRRVLNNQAFGGGCYPGHCDFHR